MAFDFFINPGNTSTAPISLFGDATSAGIAAGNAQKTKTQAVMEGISSGITQGLDWGKSIESIQTSNIQQEAAQRELNAGMPELKAQQATQNIEETKLKNQTTQETLAAGGPAADVAYKKALTEREYVTQQKAALDLQLATQNKELTDAAYVSKTTAEIAKSKQDIQDANALKTLTTQFSGWTPQQQTAAIMGDTYANVYNKNPNLLQQHIAQVAPYASPEEQIVLDGMNKKVAAKSVAQKDMLDAQKKMSEIQPDVQNSNTINDIARSLQAKGIHATALDVHKYVREVPTGTYEYNADGTIKTKDGEFVKGARQPSDPIRSYDIISNNERIKEDVPTKEWDLIKSWQNVTERVTGRPLQVQNEAIKTDTQAKLDAAKAQKAPQASSTPTPVFAPSLPEDKLATSKNIAPILPNKSTIIDTVKSVPTVTAEGKTNLVNNPMLYTTIQKQLNMDDTKFATVKKPITAVLSTIQEGKKGHLWGYSKEQDATMASAKADIINKLAEDEFNSNENIKNSYTWQDVMDHNKSVTALKMYTRADTYPGGGTALFANRSAAQNLPLEERFIALTPYDLFRLKNSQKYNTYVNNLMQAAEDSITVTRQAQQLGSVADRQKAING